MAEEHKWSHASCVKQVVFDFQDATGSKKDFIQENLSRPMRDQKGVLEG